MNARTPSWGRVAAGTVALFAIVLAFLAGKVKAGGDPTQTKAISAPAVTQPEQEPAPLTTQQS